jgi:hypothetical protein
MKRGKNGLIRANGNISNHYDPSSKDYVAARDWIKKS